MNVRPTRSGFTCCSARVWDISGDEIALGLRTFKGVVRRQQVVGEAAGVTVVTTSRTHPTAIGVTLEAIAERFPGRRILAAFEPRVRTRRVATFFKTRSRPHSTRASRVYPGVPVYFKENDSDSRPASAWKRARFASANQRRGLTRSHARSNDRSSANDRRRSRRRTSACSCRNGPFDGLKERFLAELKGR